MSNKYDTEIKQEPPKNNMPEAQPQPQPMYYPAPAPSSGGGVTLVIIVLLVMGFGLVVYELYFVSDKNSLINRIYSRIGGAEGKKDDALEKEKTELEYALSTALAEVERITGAYNIMFTMNAEVTKMAYQLEATLFQSQLEALDSTQTMDKFGTNIMGVGCMLGAFTGDRSLCRAKENMQDDILKRKKELMEKHRSQVPQNMINGLVSPRDLLSNEFKILRQKYPSKLGKSHALTGR